MDEVSLRDHRQGTRYLGHSAWGAARQVALLALFLLLVALPWESWFGGRIQLGDVLAPPSLAHPLGTDNLGRDLLVRIAAALRDSVLPLWASVIAGGLVGMMLALVSILWRSRRRNTPLIRLFELAAVVLASIPLGLLVFAWAVWREAAGLTPVVVCLSGLFLVRSYLHTCDLFRHDSRLGYWAAHAALGGGMASRLWRYGVMVGWKWSLFESLAFHLRIAVAIEASLSYLGFGVQEPQASFGNLLASHFDLYLKGQFWILLVILAALTLTAAVPGALIGLMARLSCRHRIQVTEPAPASLRSAALV